jgi:hypothetical protein
MEQVGSTNLNPEVSKENTIQIDIKEVEQQLAKDKQYIDEKTGTHFELYQDNTLEKYTKESKYLVKLKGTFEYFGVLGETDKDQNLVRSHFGKNINSNKDIYLGCWKDNLKDKHGVYIHPAENGEIQIYIGFWSNGVKSDRGIYIWKKSDDLYKYLLDFSFDAVFGNFNDKEFSSGFYISQKLDEDKTIKRYAYKGKFREGKKNDENCLYYQYHDRKLFYGKMENDSLISGYIVTIAHRDTTNSEEEEIEKIFHFQRPSGPESAAKDIIYQNEIEGDKKEEIIRLALEFLSNLNDYDFFKQLAEYVGNVLDQVDQFSLIENFNNGEKFAHCEKVLSDYSDFHSKANLRF